MGTAGDRWLKVPAAALDHRRFWDAMDTLDADALHQVEVRLGQRMVTEFGLDLAALALDMTNFATFIDSANTAAPIAQRGTRHRVKASADQELKLGLGDLVTHDDRTTTESSNRGAKPPARRTALFCVVPSVRLLRGQQDHLHEIAGEPQQ